MRLVLSTTDQSLVESFRLALEARGIRATITEPAGFSLPFLPTSVRVEDAAYDRARAILATLQETPGAQDPSPRPPIAALRFVVITILLLGILVVIALLVR